MILKRIDLFLPSVEKHELLNYFTNNFYDALLRLGVNCRRLESERLNPLPFLKQIFDDAPECTLSFNGLLPDAEGRFFCDMLKMPHVSYLVSSPHHFFSLTNTSLNVIACSDRLYAQIYKSMGHNNTLFLPHGVDPNLHHHEEVSKKYDVLFIDNGVNWQSIQQEWEKKYPENIAKAMAEAADETFKKEGISSVQALASSLQRHAGEVKLRDKEEFNLSVMLDEVEDYLRSKNTCCIAEALKGCNCHVIGSKGSLRSWQQQFGSNKSFTFEEKENLSSVIIAMRKSKIIINGSPVVKDGTDDYTFMAMVSGAAVMTSNNRYLQEHFKDGEELIYYSQTGLSSLAEKVKMLLADDGARTSLAMKGKNSVLHHHTWDHRAATLIKEIAPIIEQIKK